MKQLETALRSSPADRAQPSSLQRENPPAWQRRCSTQRSAGCGRIGKERGLDLHHNAVSRLEHVIHRGQTEAVRYSCTVPAELPLSSPSILSCLLFNDSVMAGGRAIRRNAPGCRFHRVRYVGDLNGYHGGVTLVPLEHVSP
jgi:hypothetical protein